MKRVTCTPGFQVGIAACADGRHGLSISLFERVRGIESAKTISGVCRNFYICTKSHINPQNKGDMPLAGGFGVQFIEQRPAYRANLASYITLDVSES